VAEPHKRLNWAFSITDTDSNLQGAGRNRRRDIDATQGAWADARVWPYDTATRRGQLPQHGAAMRRLVPLLSAHLAAPPWDRRRWSLSFVPSRRPRGRRECSRDAASSRSFDYRALGDGHPPPDLPQLGEGAPPACARVHGGVERSPSRARRFR
jgi:hypothetical protein